MNKVLFSILAVALLALCGCNRQTNEEVVKETYIHKYGVIVPKKDWESRGSDGQVIQTLKNGVMITKCYEMGKLQGTTTYTFSHSQTIQKTMVYDQGHLNKETENYPSGLPQIEKEYLTSNAYKNTQWYENGSLRLVEEYQDTLLLNGEYHTLANELETEVRQGDGARTVRDAFGMLSSTDTIEAGEMTSRMTYHPNGTPKEVIPYVNGWVDGTKRSYHSGGEPNTIEEWVNGQQHGLTVVFQNGERFAEIRYVRGQKHGIERRFRDGEVVEEEITWVKNQQHGPTYAYVGESAQVFWYHQGEKVSKNTFDKLNSAIR